MDELDGWWMDGWVDVKADLWIFKQTHFLNLQLQMTRYRCAPIYSEHLNIGQEHYKRLAWCSDYW
jgi:hypothetical protein